MSTDKEPPQESDHNLKETISSSAIAFRGYNVTNLGKTPELLEHPVYHKIVKEHLEQASRLASNALNKKIDLFNRVQNRVPTDLETYPETLAMIVAIELAQLKLLDEHFGIKFKEASFLSGYSLGEVTAVIAADVFSMEEVLTPILTLAPEAAELAEHVSMGILFSRGPALDFETVKRLCLEISNQGEGIISISSFLSPNTALLLGQNNTIDQFKKLVSDNFPKGTHLKKNPHHWPPIHTPITREKSIPDRAAMMMVTAKGGFTEPTIPILSCVTGDYSYTQNNSRDILNQWIDTPQKLWDVIDKTLSSSISTIIHVGPEPNIIPATLTRLSNNIALQLGKKTIGGFGLRAVSRMVRRPWLTALLSTDAALLRAPFIEQIFLEDWLLEQQID